MAKSYSAYGYKPKGSSERRPGTLTASDYLDVLDADKKDFYIQMNGQYYLRPQIKEEYNEYRMVTKIRADGKEYRERQPVYSKGTYKYIDQMRVAENGISSLCKVDYESLKYFFESPNFVGANIGNEDAKQERKNFQVFFEWFMKVKPEGLGHRFVLPTDEKDTRRDFISINDKANKKAHKTKSFYDYGSDQSQYRYQLDDIINNSNNYRSKFAASGNEATLDELVSYDRKYNKDYYELEDEINSLSAVINMYDDWLNAGAISPPIRTSSITDKEYSACEIEWVDFELNYPNGGYTEDSLKFRSNIKRTERAAIRGGNNNYDVDGKKITDENGNIYPGNPKYTSGKNSFGKYINGISCAVASATNIITWAAWKSHINSDNSGLDNLYTGASIVAPRVTPIADYFIHQCNVLAAFLPEIKILDGYITGKSINDKAFADQVFSKIQKFCSKYAKNRTTVECKAHDVDAMDGNLNKNLISHAGFLSYYIGKNLPVLTSIFVLGEAKGIFENKDLDEHDPTGKTISDWADFYSPTAFGAHVITITEINVKENAKDKKDAIELVFSTWGVRWAMNLNDLLSKRGLGHRVYDFTSQKSKQSKASVSNKSANAISSVAFYGEVLQ